MARLFRVIPIELRPGVSTEEFEKFLNEDWVEVLSAPGVRSYMLKGDRGASAGRYQLVLEYDRVETRDLYSPTGNEQSELSKQLNARGEAAPDSIHAEARWAELVSSGWADNYTDWKLVAEQIHPTEIRVRGFESDRYLENKANNHLLGHPSGSFSREFEVAETGVLFDILPVQFSSWPTPLREVRYLEDLGIGRDLSRESWSEGMLEEVTVRRHKEAGYNGEHPSN